LNKSLNILICPLEWGLGHAARMIPVARKLQEMDQNVIIGSGEEHLSLFRNEVPGLKYICFPGFKPGYSRILPQYLSLLIRLPVLIYHIISEHYRVKKILYDYDVDIIISDNRFGLWNKGVTSVYITHMPRIPFPKPFEFFEQIGVLIHRKIIRKYTFCFIPDLPDKLNLTGRLSHGVKLTANTRYIGILSRFPVSDKSQSENPDISPYNIVILSGPEPQREILKLKLITLLKDKETRTIMFEGKTGIAGEISRSGNITFYSHLSGMMMRDMINNSTNIITRSGYTTIMELVSQGRSALIIPTPGQTEQEYLAKYMSEKGWFNTVTQKKLKESNLCVSAKSECATEINRQSKILLNKALTELLEKHHKEDTAKKSGK
jgi:hypothetical protein